MNNWFALLWPFKYELPSDRDDNLDVITESFKQSQVWKLIGDTVRSDAEEIRSAFATWQYLETDAHGLYPDLSPPPNKDNKGVNACRIFRCPLCPENSSYTVTFSYKENKTTHQETVQLRLEELEMQVYRFGCGILSFKISDDGCDQKPDDKVIKRFADSMRRISIPFIPPKDNYALALCADRIQLIIKDRDGKDLFPDVSSLNWDVVGLFKTFYSDPANSVKPLTERAPFLEYIVTGGGTDIFKTIKPFADDRMYTMQLIRSKEGSEKIKKYYNGDLWGNKDSVRIGFKDDLYSRIYLDPDDATCRDEEMLEEQLHRTVYSRWAGYGTLYGMTEKSLSCLTTTDGIVEDMVIRPFKTMYYYLFSLVVAQRAGIIMFSEKAGKLAGEIKGSNETVDKLLEIKTEFERFHAQVLLLNGSEQDQGIEMYQKIKAAMNIDALLTEVEQQMDRLYEINDILFKSTIEFIAIVVSFAALLLAIPPLFPSCASSVGGIVVAISVLLFVGVLSYEAELFSLLVNYLKRMRKGKQVRRYQNKER